SRSTTPAGRRKSRRTSSWCTTSRASTSQLRRGSWRRRATASISRRSTAACARSWSRAPAARACSPNTTCSPAYRRAPTDASPYCANAVKLIARERGAAPMFVLVYNAATHFPWTHPYRPDLTPAGWRDPGNALEADEYLRRQAISARDYREFIEHLKRELAGEPVLIVRFGDHQPSFARSLIDPAFDDSALSRRIADRDPRFLATYYTIEALNFRPVDVSSALKTLDAPYLPLVVLEAAGMPLDPSFAEQKRILQRCGGKFYACAGGAEARRFNRLLIV